MNKKIAWIVLVGGSLFLAGTAWSLQQEEPQAPEPGARLESRLTRQLNLTTDQQAKFDALRQARQDRRLAFREEMRKLKDEFRVLRNDPQSDPTKADGLIDRMSKLKADWMKAGLRHRQEIDRILTPRQKEKLALLRSRIQNRMNRFSSRAQGFDRFMGRRGFDRPGWRLNRMRRFY